MRLKHANVNRFEWIFIFGIRHVFWLAEFDYSDREKKSRLRRTEITIVFEYFRSFDDREIDEGDEEQWKFGCNWRARCSSGNFRIFSDR